MSNGLRGRSVLVYDCSSWSGYLLQRLLPRATRIPAWRGQSSAEVLSAVTVARTGMRTVVVFHVDLTFADEVPVGRRALTEELGRRGLTLVNHQVIDISKRSLQRSCAKLGLPTTAARRYGPPDELVMVKTDRNYGGVPELMAERRADGADVGPGKGAPEPPEYTVARRCDLDDAVWSRPDLFVETYVSNRRGLIYRAIVVGAATAFMMYRSSRRVARVPADHTLVVAPERVPDAVRSAVARLAAHCGIRFGAFDVLHDDNDRAFVIDFNSTPFWGGTELGKLTDLSRSWP
ncbi:hypothetical protein ACFVUY_08340 [Kitasatospora sp. NPDC058063]|uniref:hypothetical protein n=1 Tax=Kitasatospora sp. NPDC058063 TaxID=3346321 RepID=UPI0036DC5B9C